MENTNNIQHVSKNPMPTTIGNIDINIHSFLSADECQDYFSSIEINTIKRSQMSVTTMSEKTQTIKSFKPEPKKSASNIKKTLDPIMPNIGDISHLKSTTCSFNIKECCDCLNYGDLTSNVFSPGYTSTDTEEYDINTEEIIAILDEEEKKDNVSYMEIEKDDTSVELLNNTDISNMEVEKEDSSVTLPNNTTVTAKDNISSVGKSNSPTNNLNAQKKRFYFPIN